MYGFEIKLEFKLKKKSRKRTKKNNGDSFYNSIKVINDFLNHNREK